MKYKVIILNGGGYHVYCPSLRGRHFLGGTIEGSLENIKEGIELYLEPDELDLNDQGKHVYISQ